MQSLRLLKKVAQFKKHPERALLKLSAPIALALLVQVVYNITDTAFVGRIGVDELAAVTFSFPLFIVLFALANMVSSGATPLIAQAVGAKQHTHACKIASQTLFIAGILAVIFTGMGLLFMRWLFSIVGASQNVISLGTQYMGPIFMAGIFFFITATFSAILTSQGETVLPAIIRGLGLLINLGLDYVFIFQFQWGITGAALATAFSAFFGAICFTYLVIFRNKGGIYPTLRNFTPDWLILKEIFGIGMPTSTALLVMSLSFLLLSKLFSQFGTATVAAFGIIGRLDTIIFMPIFGLSIGMITLVGMFYGAKEYALIVRVIKATLWYGILYSIPFAILFWGFPNTFLSIMTQNAQVVAIARPLLRIEVFSYPLMIIGFNLGWALLALGFGTPNLVITSVRLLFVAVPLAWILTSILGFGAWSIIAAMIVAGLVSSVLAALWTHNKLKEIKTTCKT